MNGIWDEGEQFVEDAPTKADFTLNEVVLSIGNEMTPFDSLDKKSLEWKI